MPTELTDDFPAAAQVSEDTMARVFASTFLKALPLGTIRLGEGRELDLWFDQPRLLLLPSPDPTANGVEVELGFTARVTDRFDEAHGVMKARAALKEVKALVAGDTFINPALDFRDSAPGDFSVTSFNPAFPDVLAGPLVNFLKEHSPFTVGPLVPDLPIQLATYTKAAGTSTKNLMAVFVGPFGTPPPRVIARTTAANGTVLLIPADRVDAGIAKALSDAGLDAASLPRTLPDEPDINLRSLAAQLRDNHVRVDGAGTKIDAFVGIDVDFTFTAFLQLLAEDNAFAVHVISTQQDVDDLAGDVLDLLSAGHLTRTLERLIPEAVQGLGGSAVGSDGLAFFARNASLSSNFADAACDGITRELLSGVVVPVDVRAHFQDPVKPPYIRGHVQSKEFHVPQGCQFGDLIGAALRKFPKREAAIQAGFDGCANCQPEFEVPEFGDLIKSALREFPKREAAIRAGFDGCANCQPEFRGLLLDHARPH